MPLVRFCLCAVVLWNASSVHDYPQWLPRGGSSLLHTEPSLPWGFVQDPHLTGSGVWRIFRESQQKEKGLFGREAGLRMSWREDSLPQGSLNPGVKPLASPSTLAEWQPSWGRWASCTQRPHQRMPESSSVCCNIRSPCDPKQSVLYPTSQTRDLREGWSMFRKAEITISVACPEVVSHKHTQKWFWFFLNLIIWTAVGHIFLGMIKGSFTYAVRSILSHFLTYLQPSFNSDSIVSRKLSRML